MSWKQIKEEIYSIVGAMTQGGGYNFDWVTIRRIDAYTLHTENCVFSLHYPDDSPFEENAQDTFPADTLSYSNARAVEFKCKPVSDMLDVDTDDVIDLNNDALDKALADIKRAFGNDTLQSCNLGVKQVVFEEAIKEEHTSKSAYYPYILSANFRIFYTEPRSL